MAINLQNFNTDFLRKFSVQLPVYATYVALTFRGPCIVIYSDTSANEDNSFRDHIRWPKYSLAET